LNTQMEKDEGLKNEYKAKKNVLKDQKEQQEKNFKGLKSRIRDTKRSFWSPTVGNISNKSRSEILENIRVLSGLTNDLYFKDQPGSNKVKKLRNLENKMERYLHNLDPDCMDFLDWHEYLPEHTPTPRC